MRQALNENPMVQMAVLALAAVVLAFVLFTSVLKKDDPAAEATTTPAPAAAATDPAAAGASVAPPADPASPPAEAGTVAPPAGSTSPATDPEPTADLKAGEGLPKNVLAAYEHGKAIALVVIDPKSEGASRLVAAARDYDRGDVEVFVVEVNGIARYSRITQGVSVSRTPALVVISPRKVSGAAPVASVAYGFRSPRSVEQAIDDAFYEGGTVPAYP